MVSRNLKTILGTIFLLLLCPLLASGVETLENPKGSVKLTKAQLRQRTGYYCGLVQARWVPGTRLSETRFYPTDAEISNLTAELRKATGRRRTAISKEIAGIKKPLPTRRLVCSAIVKSSTKRSLTKVLKTQSSKWTNFQSIRRAAGQSQSNSGGVRPMDANVLFNVSGAVALAKPETPTGSNLLAVDSSGNATDALVSGVASVQNFYVTPNGRIYVVFASKIPLVDGAQPCLLAEIDKQSGVPTCVDTSLDSIELSQFYRFPGAIQFDDAGNIFYTGRNTSFKTVLRRSSNGQPTDLINDNIWLWGFLVLPNGGVIVSGTTASTSVSWVRRISASGSLSTLVSGTSAIFLERFADGNVYFGLWGSRFFGVQRYLIGSNAIDPKYWISGDINSDTPSRYFDAGKMCETDRNLMEGFCGLFGANIRALYNYPGKATYVISGFTGQPGSVLMQYYPTVEKQEVSFSDVSLSVGAGKKIVLTGTNANGGNITTLFNTETKVETTVVDSANEIEMYNITYVQTTNKVMFNGLRFSDNQFVVGEINIGD